MKQPVTELDTRFSDQDAFATDWEETRRVLENADLFWISTVRVDGRPHVTPLVAVWLDDVIYFATGPGEQKAVNLRTNRNVILTTGCSDWERGLDVVVEGSMHPDTQGVPWHEEFPREVLIGAELDGIAAGDVRYAGLCGGALAGGATMRIAEGVAQLTGAATAPAHRRRGVQTALLAARLADAAAAGCDVAVIVTQPGSKSQQNAQRQGFDLLYTRAVLVKHPGTGGGHHG